MKKTIGILGGMGPEATAYFFELIIANTQVEKDQDHIPIIIYSNPKIPERTAALLKKGPSPVPLLKKSLEVLAMAGADFIVMPCITAHAFYPRFAAGMKIPFVNLLDETLVYVQKSSPRLERIGLIASSGTLKSQLFHRTFAKAGIEVIHPDLRDQDRVMTAIFGPKGIKAGFTSGTPKKIIQDVAARLISRGAEAVVAGCTEVPLVLKDRDLPVPLIDPLRIAAQACILRAGYQLRNADF